MFSTQTTVNALGFTFVIGILGQLDMLEAVASGADRGLDQACFLRIVGRPAPADHGQVRVLRQARGPRGAPLPGEADRGHGGLDAVEEVVRAHGDVAVDSDQGDVVAQDRLVNPEVLMDDDFGNATSDRWCSTIYNSSIYSLTVWIRAQGMLSQNNVAKYKI